MPLGKPALATTAIKPLRKQVWNSHYVFGSRTEVADRESNRAWRCRGGYRAYM